MKTIVLAGGCFWGVEAYFKRIRGVLATKVGYANGIMENPSYEDVCYRDTGHAEVCQVNFDEKILPLEKILDHFFRIVDPTTSNRQGNDVGEQYRSGIYYSSQEDLPVIKDFINKISENYTSPIVTEVVPLDKFYEAEEYHQKYLEKNPLGYCHINFSLLKDEEKQNPV